MSTTPPKPPVAIMAPTLKFEDALTALKSGKKIRRTGQKHYLMSIEGVIVQVTPKVGTNPASVSNAAQQPKWEDILANDWQTTED